MSASRSSGGLLLAAVERGEHVPPTWTAVDVGDGLSVSVSTDALHARVPEAMPAIRLPVSYAETIAICRALGCIAPTREIGDALWRAATVRPVPRPLVFTGEDARRMSTVEWSLRHHEAIEAQLDDAPDGTLIADVGKDWILDNGLSVIGAVNYGWRMSASCMLQPAGHMHDAGHFDYSQVLRLVCRFGVLNGETVDLLDVLTQRGLSARWAAPYR